MNTPKKSSPVTHIAGSPTLGVGLLIAGLALVHLRHARTVVSVQFRSCYRPVIEGKLTSPSENRGSIVVRSREGRRPRGQMQLHLFFVGQQYTLTAAGNG